MWNIISHYTLVKETVFENVCHCRTRVSAFATRFLQTVFSTVHYVIMLRKIPCLLYDIAALNPLLTLQKDYAVLNPLFVLRRECAVFSPSFCCKG